MSDAMSAFVRLFTSDELPVRIPDWPEGVGLAVCRAGGRTISMQPYHVEETGAGLRRRLVDEVGPDLSGFRVYPGMQGIAEADISASDDQRITQELEQSLRSMPRLIETVHDFAINFAFAIDEGLGLDGLGDAARAKGASAPKPEADQLPVGYQLFERADPDSVVIAGAMLKPVGAQGVDLYLSGDPTKHSREIPAEPKVLVRDDSLRVAIPLSSVMQNGVLPQILRLPAGALILNGSGGKIVPAQVLRRGSYLFVAPEVASVGAPISTAKPVSPGPSGLWKWLLLGLLALVMVAGIAVGTTMLLLSENTAEEQAPVAPVNALRNNLFAPDN